MEFATIKLVNDKVVYHFYKPAEIDALLKEHQAGGITEDK